MISSMRRTSPPCCEPSARTSGASSARAARTMPRSCSMRCRIGKAVAHRLEALGMKAGYHGRSRQQEVALPFFPSLIELAAWSDFLIVACPGGGATRHLVNAEVLRALGPQGTLINIARGSIVD